MSTNDSQAKSPRVRRSAAESRARILEVAGERLAAHGVAGLNVADVARDAGISHGTILHHFGSSAGMRRALVEAQSEQLLDEVLELELAPTPDTARMGDFMERMFQALSQGGHARLIAWLAASPEAWSEGDGMGDRAERLEALLAAIAQRIEAVGYAPDALQSARYLILMVFTSAIGLGVARETILQSLVNDAEDEARYARWLGQVIGVNLGVIDPQTLKPTDSVE